VSQVDPTQAAEAGAANSPEVEGGSEAPPMSVASSTKGTGRAAMVEVVAYVANVAIRMGSSLILTRLLVPKDFGLMALFHSVNFVLWMLSDVGITQAVIMSKRGEEQKFLDTAFTLHVVRGFGLWAAMCALTWPLSIAFREPALLWVMPIASFATVLHGFQSPRVFLMRKQVKPLPLLKLDLVTQLSATAIGVGFAYAGYGVTSMLISWLAVGAIYTVGSYFLPGTSYRPKFGSEPESRQEIMHFGRWIFFSSCLTSVAQKGDQLLLGRLLGVTQLGTYNIALQLAELPENLTGNVINSVVYPTLSRVKNERPESFSDAFYHIRRWFDPLIFVALGGLVGMSHWLIDLLYDERYAPAAAALQVLAVRTGIQVLAILCESCFTAHGESQFSFKRNLFVSSTLMVAMPVGFWMFGFYGVLWGSVVARSMSLVALWPEARRRGYVRLHRELLAVPYGLLGLALGMLFSWLLPSVR
jgi:O-antigen/teichoic acid export membrane protein